MREKQTMIETRELVKWYRTGAGQTTALAGVSLRIEEGEFVAVMGPSGCGKSTLLNLLGLLDNPSRGEYYLLGREVSRYSEAQRARLRKSTVGFIFQRFNLIETLTVYENVELPLHYQRRPPGERRRRVGEVLERLGLFTGLAAGWYPALTLSRAQPAAMLRGAPLNRPRGSFSQGLMVLQFALAIFLVVCVVVMGAQMRLLLRKDLGFDGDQVVAVDLQHNENPEVIQLFRDQLRGAPGVVAVSGAVQVPGLSFLRAIWKPGEGEELSFHGFRVEAAFWEVMGLRLAAGRWLDPERDAPEAAVVVNEGFARQVGGNEVVGRPLPDLPKPGQQAERTPVVVGVVQDFHFRDLRQAIGPAVLELQDKGLFGYRYLLVRLDPGRQAAGLAAVEQAWGRVAGAVPFTCHRLRERLDTYHADTERWIRLVRWSALLTLLIAGLAVFGLAALTARRRTRELGIRKALGASGGQLVGLLVWEFTRLVLLANLLAWPAAYLAMRWWLQGFAYRIGLGPQYFALAGLVGLVIAWGAASWHAVQTARANPADTLRQP